MEVFKDGTVVIIIQRQVTKNSVEGSAILMSVRRDGAWIVLFVLNDYIVP